MHRFSKYPSVHLPLINIALDVFTGRDIIKCNYRDIIKAVFRGHIFRGGKIISHIY